MRGVLEEIRLKERGLLHGGLSRAPLWGGGSPPTVKYTERMPRGARREACKGACGGPAWPRRPRTGAALGALDEPPGRLPVALSPWESCPQRSVHEQWRRSRRAAGDTRPCGRRPGRGESREGGHRSITGPWYGCTRAVCARRGSTCPAGPGCRRARPGRAGPWVRDGRGHLGGRRSAIGGGDEGLGRGVMKKWQGIGQRAGMVRC